MELEIEDSRNEPQPGDSSSDSDDFEYPPSKKALSGRKLEPLSSSDIKVLDERRRHRRARRRADRRDGNDTLRDWMKCQGWVQPDTCVSVASSDESMGDVQELDLRGNVKAKYGFFNPPGFRTMAPMFYCCKRECDTSNSDLQLTEREASEEEEFGGPGMTHLNGIGIVLSWRSAESAYTRIGDREEEEEEGPEGHEVNHQTVLHSYHCNLTNLHLKHPVIHCPDRKIV